MRTLPNRRAPIDFSSNDYLGFAREPLSVSFAGATGSRLLTGNTEAMMRLESMIAAFHGREAALLFPCGYMANLGLLSCLCTREDRVLFDRQVHASMRDGIVLSRARAFGWKHNDVDHLESLLKKQIRRCIVCMESLYSTDGSLGDVESVSRLCQHYGADLIVDEAHALGVFGPGRAHGRALTAQVVTFGKALGAHGAAVLGSRALVAQLINACRPFIYTTGLPTASIEAIGRGYARLQQDQKPREQLWARIHQARLPSPIFAYRGPAQAETLQKAGFDVRPLRPPTVRQECLRITLHSYNTPQEVDALWKLLS